MMMFIIMMMMVMMRMKMAMMEKRLRRAPSKESIPTLGLLVYLQDLLWAVWSSGFSHG